MNTIIADTMELCGIREETTDEVLDINTNTIKADCMELCGIREETTDEVPDSFNDTVSNVNYVQDDLAILVNTFVAADVVPVDALKDDIPPTSLDILATDSAVPNDGIQQHPFEDPLTLPDAIEIPDDSVQWCPVADSTVALPNDIHVYNDDIQQDPDQASAVEEPNDIEVYNVNPQQHTVETATCDVPNDIEVHTDELQQHILETSEQVEKGINAYVQVIASTILQSPQQMLLVSEIYENITQNWQRFSLNERTWKTSVRHALSHNPFFIHNGRGPNGRSHYWSVHEACVKMFKRGDFRRMEAKRRVQHMEREKESMKRQEKQLNQHQQVQYHNYQQPQAKYQHPLQQQKLHQHQQLLQARQLPQAPQMPQIQQLPQAPQLSQTQQLPQTQQRPHAPQLPQAQQTFQNQQLPQYPQQPQYQKHQSQQQPLHQQQYQHLHQSQYPQQQYQQYNQHQPQHQAQHMERSDCLFGSSQNPEFHQPYPGMRSQPEDMMSSTTGYYSYNNLRSAMDYNSANSPAPSQCTSDTAYYNNTAQQHQQYY